MPQGNPEAYTLAALLGDPRMQGESPEAKADMMRQLVARGFMERPKSMDEELLTQLLGGRSPAIDFLRMMGAVSADIPTRRRPDNRPVMDDPSMLEPFAPTGGISQAMADAMRSSGQGR